MNRAELRELLASVQDGTCTLESATERICRLPFADVGDALVDHHRSLRQGAPEAVYGPGKTPAQCVDIVTELLAGSRGPVLATRLDTDQRRALDHEHPGAIESGSSRTSAESAMLWRAPLPRDDLSVAVVTAGTADLPVADEADITLASLGIAATRITDVGVAGLHRLLARLDEVTAADAVIVIAGMEGALASVIGGVTAAPVVAVPTSVGYGSGLDGVTALLAMTASCASGVTVVGIDNGFGAAMAIGRLMNATSQ